MTRCTDGARRAGGTRWPRIAEESSRYSSSSLDVIGLKLGRIVLTTGRA